MNADKHRFRFYYLRSSAFICGFIFCGICFAQSKTGEGLDSINDDILMSELANRGLDTLLERAFEVNRIPETQRAGQRTLIALARLGDTNARWTTTQRQQFLNDIIKGIDQTLPTINDPSLLMQQANILIRQGVEREVNTLEYWGENPSTQAAVRPVMQAVNRILDKCIVRAKALAEEASIKINQPNSTWSAKYEEYEKLRTNAEYTKNVIAYYLALALDPAGPERARVATDATNYLKQFDLPENPDRGFVRNRLAKLAMVKGDFDAARTFFAAVIQDTNLPRPTIPQQYEARYFLAVTELLAKNLDGAKKGLNDLLAWQKANLPPDKTSQDGAEAAAVMLQYRIETLTADLATDPGAKADANSRAVALLMNLMEKRPDLRSAIYTQLLPKLNDKTDLNKLEPLALRAIVARGEQELNRPRTDPVDEGLLIRAINAAKEIIRRKAQPQMSPQMVDGATLLVPFFMDRLGKKVEAATGFLDYVEQFKKTNQQNATLALDNAQSIIGELRASAESRQDPDVTRQYERFLPIAIAEPFNRKQFAFEYARRLQLNGNEARAIEYYHMVPADDKRMLQAAFGELVALKRQLDEAPTSPQRAQIIAQIQTLADRVNAGVDRAVAAATTDADRTAARSMRVRTLLLAADLARREQKNPRRAVELLANFESTVNGVANSDPLVNEAMYIRVQSYMAQEQYTQATDELVKLLNKTEGSQGAQIVYNLLQKLNADFDRAQQANDADAMRGLARNRAQLSGFLVKWATENTDPNIRKFTYRYSVFDAETQRRAAELDANPQTRQAGMKQALERYTALESAPNVALYKASLGNSPQASDANLFDPQVTFAIAQIHYELGDWRLAADGFSKLLTTRKLGSPVETTEESGVEKSVDNDQYWEAVLKLTRCNQKLNAGVDESKSFLKMQYVTWGPHVGGKRWKKEFEALRAELIPDLKIDDAPTTQR